VIVQGPAGRLAHSVAEKEALVLLSLTPPHTPWVSVFRVGAPCERGKIITWFPCSLLVSAVKGSRRVAMEYRCWLPETTPRFDRQEARRRFGELVDQRESGVWISRSSSGIHAEDLFLRDSRVLWDQDADDEIVADPVYFPSTAPVAGLQAARTIRAFCRTGRRAQHIVWTAGPPQDTAEGAPPAGNGAGHPPPSRAQAVGARWSGVDPGQREELLSGPGVRA
jgi:hypothetical protein